MGSPSDGAEHAVDELGLVTVAVCTVAGVIALQWGAGQLDAFVAGRKQTHEIVTMAYRELMILGLAALGLFLLQSSGALVGEAILHAFEQIHMGLFLVALLYTGSVMYLVRLSTKIAAAWWRMERRCAEFAQYKQVKTEFRRLKTALSLRAVQRQEVMDTVRFAEARYKFLVRNSLPRDFSMSAYLRKCAEHVFLELVDIPTSMWATAGWAIGVDLYLRAVVPGFAEWQTAAMVSVTLSLLALAFSFALDIQVRNIYWKVMHSDEHRTKVDDDTIHRADSFSVVFQHDEALQAAHAANRAAVHQSEESRTGSMHPTTPDTAPRASPAKNMSPLLHAVVTKSLNRAAMSQRSFAVRAGAAQKRRGADEYAEVVGAEAEAGHAASNTGTDSLTPGVGGSDSAAGSTLSVRSRPGDAPSIAAGVHALPSSTDMEKAKQMQREKFPFGVPTLMLRFMQGVLFIVAGDAAIVVMVIGSEGLHNTETWAMLACSVVAIVIVPLVLQRVVPLYLLLMHSGALVDRELLRETLYKYERHKREVHDLHAAAVAAQRAQKVAQARKHARVLFSKSKRMRAHIIEPKEVLQWLAEHGVAVRKGRLSRLKELGKSIRGLKTKRGGPTVSKTDSEKSGAADAPTMDSGDSGSSVGRAEDKDLQPDVASDSNTDPAEGSTADASPGGAPDDGDEKPGEWPDGFVRSNSLDSIDFDFGGAAPSNGKRGRKRRRSRCAALPATTVASCRAAACEWQRRAAARVYAFICTDLFASLLSSSLLATFSMAALASHPTMPAATRERLLIAVAAFCGAFVIEQVLKMWATGMHFFVGPARYWHALDAVTIAITSATAVLGIRDGVDAALPTASCAVITLRMIRSLSFLSIVQQAEPVASPGEGAASDALIRLETHTVLRQKRDGEHIHHHYHHHHHHHHHHHFNPVEEDDGATPVRLAAAVRGMTPGGVREGQPGPPDAGSSDREHLHSGGESDKSPVEEGASEGGDLGAAAEHSVAADASGEDPHDDVPSGSDHGKRPAGEACGAAESGASDQ